MRAWSTTTCMTAKAARRGSTSPLTLPRLVHIISVGTPVWVRPAAVLPGDTAVDRRGRSPSVYEVGHGIVQGHSGLTPPLGVLASQSNIYPSSSFNLRSGANEMPAYQWDENDTCLLVGSTFLHVTGHHAADLPLEDFTNPDVPGKWVVLKTTPNDASVPARTWLVRLIRVTDEVDPLTATNITKLEWEEAQATPFELELETLVVRGNIVPATAGETLEAFFEIEPTPQALVLPASPPRTLAGSEPVLQRKLLQLRHRAIGAAFLTAGLRAARSRLAWSKLGSCIAGSSRHGWRQVAELVTAKWEWKRSMLGVSSSLPTDKHFTLDDGSWRRVASYRRVDETGTPQDFIHFDYANGRGATVQFGNGEFGEVPTRGLDLRVIYRLGRGRGDNVAADSLTDFDKDPVTLPFVIAVTNPFGITDAIDPETPEAARHVAPEAFRAETFRAVRAEDYAAAVEKLDWVQRAGAQFRWTGSWLTLFATPDPKGSFALTVEERRDLERQLDRYRLAGRETHGMNPKFANLDLEIHICVAPTSYIGEVKEAVLEVLFGRRGVRPHYRLLLPRQLDLWRSTRACPARSGHSSGARRAGRRRHLYPAPQLVCQANLQ